MWELWSTVKANEWLPKDREVNDDLFTLLFSRGICGCNPIIRNRTIGKNTCVKVGGFSSMAVKPKASS
jgi:hypothetical protein